MIANLERWKSAQIQAAIERGVNKIDAARALDEFMQSVPWGADPETYVRPAKELDQPVSQEIIADARAAWFADVDDRYDRLLDAKEID
jgi:hypothetical protein